MAYPALSAVAVSPVRQADDDSSLRPYSLTLSRRWCVSALLLLLGAGAACFLYGAWDRVWAAHGLGYGEGILVWQAQHIVNPAAAYDPIERYPYIVFHYPPVFHLSAVALSWLTSNLIAAGRLVSLLSTLGIMAVLAAIAFRALPATATSGARATAAACATLLPTSLATVQFWVPQFRVDMIGLFLTLLGLFAFLEGHSRPLLKYAAVVCLVAGLYSKQTLLAAPMACLLVSAVVDRRDTWRLLATAVVLGLIPMVWMQLATDGQFARHLFLYNQNPFSLGRTVSMVRENLSGMLPLVCVALAAPLVWLAADRRDSRAERLRRRRVFACLYAYAAIAFVISWTAGKRGSDVNYFLEWNLVCCALAAIGISGLLDGPARVRLTFGTAVALAAVFGYASLRLATGANATARFTAGARQLEAALEEQERRVVALLREIPDPILAYDMMPLIEAGKEVPLEPAIVFDLARSGMWDTTPLVHEIQRHRYSLIVRTSFADSFDTPEVRAAIQAAYEPQERIGDFEIWRPRPQ